MPPRSRAALRAFLKALSVLRLHCCPMDFFVYSRKAIELVRPHEVPHVIISITSTRDDVAVLRANDHCRGILRLSFLDADESSEPMVGSELFSLDQARQIWTFVERHQGDVQRLLVHCDMGISRSPAVAAALALILNGNGDEFLLADQYVPNTLVYRLLLETAPNPTSSPPRP
jgi:predicted protein tyrosine phosphatase